MSARPRVLVVSPHPDDETFFFGGTLARYAAVADVSLLVLTNGEKGSIAVEDAEAGVLARRRPDPDELATFAAVRMGECREAARRLGIGAVTFAGLPDGGLPVWLVPTLRKAIRDTDPHLVLSPSEAGTTLHPDHCWAALALDLAIDSLLREAYGPLGRDAELPSPPPFALRRWLTFTLPEAEKRFDYWSEIVAPDESLTRIDVRTTLAQKRAAAEAYRTQRHWLRFFDRVGCLDLPNECFIERMCIGASAAATTDLFAGLGEGTLSLRRDLIPGEPERYTSSLPSHHVDLLGRAEWTASRLLKTVVLASGHGTRMQNPALPKSLEPLAGRPIVRHIIDSLVASGADDRPIVVVGPLGEQIRAELGPDYVYVDQPEPLGTGHAIGRCEEALLRLGAAHVLSVYGDMPMVTPETFRALVTQHLLHQSPLTMGIVDLPDYDDWRSVFRTYGRVLTDDAGNVLRIVEIADANEEELMLRCVNPSLFVFSTAFLRTNIGKLRPNNRQGQLYLTDLVGLAVDQGTPPKVVRVPAEDALGANRRSDLDKLEAVLAERLRRAERRGTALP